MKMNKKRFTARAAITALLLLTVALLFSSCGGSAPKPTLTMGSIVADSTCSMNAEQYDKVGKLLVSVYDDANFDVRDWLIAASRGYDMTAEGFDDGLASPTEKGSGNPAEIAVKVIDKANDKAGDSRIERANYETMNESDLNTLIRAFKTQVNTSQQGSWYDPILRLVGRFLNWITTYLGFGSYIVGICIFAVIVEIVMLPFAIKQQKNSIRQAMLRPKEMAIRNKYKGRNDQVTQQKVQKEIQELYQRENYSPFAGCMPLLLQFPILIALYQIVIDPLHYALGQGSGVSAALNSYYTAARAAGGMGQTLAASGNNTISLLAGNNVEAFAGIKDFAYFNNGADVWSSLQNIREIPNFNIFGINFGQNPSLERVDWLLLVPVITFLVYFFSMKLSRKFTYQPAQQGVDDRQAACSNTMMDVSMPLMSTFFAFMVPGLIGVYWIFRSLLTTLKQFIMSRAMPLPQFTEEDYKAAAKELAGKAPRVEKSANAGKVRSLHHIDDEDYDDTREQALRRRALMEEKDREERAKKAENSPFSAPELKKDSKDETNTESDNNGSEQN